MNYCPHCHASSLVKNGRHPKTDCQKYRCQTCGRQFVQNPKKQRVGLGQKSLIGRLLLERIPLAGIARVVGVSERWLQNYVNRLYARVPRRVEAKPNRRTALCLECDELWSFVGNKGNKQWVWLALDRKTRAIIGVHVGDRSRAGAQALWDSLPEAYRESAVCYTDYWEAYRLVFPEDRHVAAGKDSGFTNHIERFNNTLRHRVSRLVRDSLAFSKKLANHIGAIWFFVHHYNLSRLDF
ncbi:MAG: IS1 family transposase [Methylovulum sp.]|uniref:IS1 family transposase n=1 Tax=Methylovulum sp. TaxID=1916980 RepID=UPI002614F319|nr:IS1 family transposase [Methylovulum sp.]MDD2725503.1 IS1 family transposase [Methylovulum sp.]